MDSTEHEILIIGAGFSGIGVAVRLEEAGLRDYLIVEQGDGLRRHLVLEPLPGPRRRHPLLLLPVLVRAEPGLVAHLRPGRRAPRLREALRRRARPRGQDPLRNEDHRRRLRRGPAPLARRDRRRRGALVRHIVDATGVLTVPKKPDIPGVDSFAGQTIHTARWDPDADLAGKRVGVIGTGRVGGPADPRDRARRRAPDGLPADADLVSAEVRQPAPRLRALDARQRARAHSAPRALLSQALVELTFPLSAHYHRPLAARDACSRARPRSTSASRSTTRCSRRSSRRGTALGCKRPSFHNTYLSTFNRENVAARDEPDRGDHRARASVTADGTEHELDVLVLATGFKVFDPGNFPKYPISGRDGRDLEEFWRVNRFQAYEGVSVPGFPNYFMVMGPYGYNGSSYFNLVETQSRHIVRCLSHAERSGATSVEVTARRQRPLLRRDDAPPQAPDLLAGELRPRQLLLLRRPRRRPAAARARRSRRCGAPAASRSPTTASVGAVHIRLTDYGSL